MSCRRKSSGVYRVRKILKHKWGRVGWELMIDWEPIGKVVYEPTWEPARDVSEDLLEDYFGQLEMVDSIPVSTDLRPLVKMIRRRVSQQVAVAKTQCRPRQHQLPVEGLQLQELALAFLEVIRSPTKFYIWMGGDQSDIDRNHRKLPLLYTKDPSDGVETWQVNYEKMQHVAAFCSFHTFLGAMKAVGALRFNIGRESNIDYATLGLPFVFKASTNPRNKGIMDFQVEFIVCHGNGKFGTLTPPHLLKGMMKDPKHFNAVLNYVKTSLPGDHVLVRKGFKQLPDGTDTLPAALAVSDGEDSSDEGGAHRVDSSDEEGAHRVDSSDEE